MKANRGAAGVDRHSLEGFGHGRSVGSGRWLATSPGCSRTGVSPGLSRLNDGSWVSGDVHAQFCEGLGVKLPGATHPWRAAAWMAARAGLEPRYLSMVRLKRRRDSAYCRVAAPRLPAVAAARSRIKPNEAPATMPRSVSGTKEDRGEDRVEEREEHGGPGSQTCDPGFEGVDVSPDLIAEDEIGNDQGPAGDEVGENLRRLRSPPEGLRERR